MALINCAECGKKVSDQATACPKCGNPIQSGQHGLVGMTSAGARESDVKRGVQRATGRHELGYAIGIVGFILALIIGAATGSFGIGLVLAIAALAAGVAFQYN